MENKVIGFGTNESLKAETPAGIKWIYRGTMLLSAAFVLVQSVYPEIPAAVQLGIYKGMTLGNGLLYLVCQQFGWVTSPRTLSDRVPPKL